MPKTTNRDSALARIFESPLLARVVPHLAPETLYQLIQHRGLDGCGDLLTSATPAQLTSLFDLDLWRHQQGRDEQFDADRFGEWLEVLVEAGASVAARTVAALDTDLVIVGLSRYVRVLDPGIFEPTEASDDEPMDRNEMMSSEERAVIECEVGGYLLRARRTDAWDAIVALLGALDTEHSGYFHAVMRGCRRLSDSTPEIDGLDDLLLAPEQHLHDVAVEREQRRSLQGYAAAGDARAFLQMARQSRLTSQPSNPIVTAYFRAADEAADTTAANAPEHAANASGQGGDTAESLDGVMALLVEAGVMPERTRALLPGAEEEPGSSKVPVLQRLMECALHQNEAAYLARGRELAFLSNVLLAGCSVQARPFTPREASDAAASICNLGLESIIAPDAFLIDHDLVTAFEAGWSALYQDVSLFAVDRLVSTLDHLDSTDTDTRDDLRALRRTLVKQREAGTPWLARDAAEVLAMLDMTAWIGILGLLDECPILPAALTAVLERRTATVSPTAFEFISTTAQIGDVRIFIGMLPRLLAS